MKKALFMLCILCSMHVFADEDNSGGYTISLAPQLAGSVIIPAGVFNEISPFGLGAEFALGINDLIVKNSALKVCVAYSFITEKIERINSFGLNSVAVFLGYSIVKNDVFRITPLLGTGCVGHVIETNEQLLFIDPLVTVQVDVDLLLLEGFYVSLCPRYTLFFEKDNMGGYVSLSFGVKKVFDLEVSGKQKQREPFIIERNTPVFSPNGDEYKDTILLTLKSEKRVPVAGYEMRILNKHHSPVKVFTGEAALAGEFTWDGRDTHGRVVADGAYTASLIVTYPDGGKTHTACDSFTVDNAPPRVRLEISSDVISPDNDGNNDTLAIRCKAEDDSEIADWILTIEDSDGRPFKQYKGGGEPPKQLVWDGKADSGRLVESAQDYPLTLVVTDVAGNTTVLKKLVKTDILVQKKGKVYKVIISCIYFEAYSADYSKASAARAVENTRIITRLAEILQKYKQYNIIIEGHTLNAYWFDKQKARREEEKVLIPLSKARAESIKRALVQRGIAAERIETVGRGSSLPLVPFNDLKNRWKNRRVEIILKK